MKNLETEYKQEVESNIPDLWDRIDKGLDEIEGPAPVYEMRFYEKPEFRTVFRKIGKFAGCAVAACFVIFITVYVIPGIGKGKSGPANESADYKEQDAKKADSAYEAIPTPATVYKEEATENTEGELSIPLVLADLEEKVITLDDGTYLLDGRSYQNMLTFTLTLPEDAKPYAGWNADITVLSNSKDLISDDLVHALEDGPEPYIPLDPEQASVIRYEITPPQEQ